MTQQATCFQYCKILRCYLNILFSGRNTPKLECQMLTSVWKGIKIKNAYFVLNKNTYIWFFYPKDGQILLHAKRAVLCYSSGNKQWQARYFKHFTSH